jgi:hypothetical protein
MISNPTVLASLVLGYLLTLYSLIKDPMQWQRLAPVEEYSKGVEEPKKEQLFVEWEHPVWPNK